MDMKHSGAKKKGMPVMVPGMMDNEYPHGLQITLGQREIYSLGIDLKDTYVGEKIAIGGKGEIAAIDRESITIQLQDLTVNKGERSFNDAVKIAKIQLGKK